MKPVLCYGSVTWTLTQMTEREKLRIYAQYKIRDADILDGKVKLIRHTNI